MSSYIFKTVYKSTVTKLLLLMSTTIGMLRSTCTILLQTIHDVPVIILNDLDIMQPYITNVFNASLLG